MYIVTVIQATSTDSHIPKKTDFEIKLTASFVFEKIPGLFCSMPAIKTELLASCQIERPEQACIAKMHDLFLHQLAPLVRQRWFSWDEVTLPNEMKRSESF